jgi:type IV pilus assembly protein PilQ
MITTILFQSRQPADARPRGVRLAARALFAVLAMTPLAAFAQNVLEAVTFNPGPGGQVDIVLTLTEPAVDPKLFTTDSPPRIAIDFDNTRNGLAERRLEVGVGAASAISAIEAAGRTRVVVELMRPTAYTTRAEGNRLILSVGTGGSAAATQVVTGNDPSKAVAGRAEVSNIDFRRGVNGEGRLIVSFTNDGVAADLRREGTKVVVELRNVALPPQFAQRLDVTDFATPVESIETRALPNGVRMEIRPNGDFESLAYQTGAEYVVEIAPKRQESEAEKRLKEPEYTGERVTFNFQDIPVRSVLQLIADVSQLNVVVADSVSGNVTLRLVNVPWDQALEIILQAKGLDKRRRGDVIWVAPTAEIAAREQALEDARIALEDRAPLVSEYIPINYGSAKSIAELLTNDALRSTQAGATSSPTGGAAAQASTGFLSKRGSVTFDERTNTLLINDTAEKVQEIRELIALLDRPVDQVLIESRIVVADETFGKEIGARFGVSGAYQDRYGNVISTGGSSEATDNINNEAVSNRILNDRISAFPIVRPNAPGLGLFTPRLADRLNVNLPITNPAGSFALAVLAKDYLLDLELSALSTEGKGEVISSPRVITSNQREAVIRQGDEIGYVTISPVASGSAAPIPNVQFKEVLLELKVTPTITQDQRVFMAMNVKKDEVSGFIDTSIGQVPQINKREINTAVLVENGQTVVLGGVYEFKSRKDLSKVPFLGDIPALGNFFRNTSATSDKAELLIFVTPKILDSRSP